jgi:tetratricopeptide (TPR) repeat protein
MLASTTNLDKCYQLLGIRQGASLNELKTSYRSLARQWHPDLNPDNIEASHRFIVLSQAYQILLAKISSHPAPPVVRTTGSTRSTNSIHYTPQQTAPTPKPRTNKAELKRQLYGDLQSLLQQQQFLKAILIVEGLAQNFPQDNQICQWQGMIYSQFGCQLVKRRKFDQARIYLSKALKVDPDNQQLAKIVNLAFNRIALLS